MAGSINVDDVIECRVNARLYGQRLMNVFHYAVTGGITADYDDWATAFHTKFTDPLTGPAFFLQGMQSNEVTYLYIDYQVVKPVRKRYIRKDYLVFGEIVGQSLPPANSVAITKRGTIAGNGRTGHVLVGGIPIDKTIDGSLTGAYRTGECDLFANTLGISITAETMVCDPIVSTAKIGGVWNKIIDGQVELGVRTVSRRVVGRGI